MKRDGTITSKYLWQTDGQNKILEWTQPGTRRRGRVDLSQYDICTANYERECE